MPDYLTEHIPVLTHLFCAMIAGSAIGLERSFHARPAGFRTHTLVCLASALLMSLSLYQWEWLPAQAIDTVRHDPTRMAQGIMTGIGFLGAGVIFKEGLTVRGLTTAASIWITAAIGILFGVGFYFPAVAATLLTFFTLSIFRWIESLMPSHSFAHLQLIFERDRVYSEQEVRSLLHNHAFTVHQTSYRISNNGTLFEYRLVISTRHSVNIGQLAAALPQLPAIRGFRLSPSGE